MSQNHLANKKSYLYGIDIIRFSSAFIVVTFHLMFSVWANQNSRFGVVLSADFRLESQAIFTWFGWIGVEIFFVISGVVIANSANGSSLKEFIQSRILRLYPAIWICATISALAILAMDLYSYDKVVQRLIHSYLLVPVYPWIDPVYWTLAVEVVFYLWVSIFIAFEELKKIYIWALLYSIICLLYNTILLINIFYGTGDTTLGISLQLSRLSLLSHGAFFSLGIFIWAIFNRGLNKITTRGLIVSFISCAVEILVHTWYVFGEIELSAFDLVSPYWYVPSFVWGLAITCIFLSYIFSEKLLVLPLSFRNLIRLLGLMTYPLYLLHFTVGVWVISFCKTTLGLENFISAFFALILMITLSFIISAFIEPALRKMVLPTIHRAFDIISKWPSGYFVLRKSFIE